MYKAYFNDFLYQIPNLRGFKVACLFVEKPLPYRNCFGYNSFHLHIFNLGKQSNVNRIIGWNLQ